MATFEFIASDDYRACLGRDAEELVLCMKAGAWKSAHVMAVSLIQATLVEYLISSGIAAEADARQAGIGDLLSLCREQQVLSPRTVDLASFLRPYSDFLSADSRVRLGAATDETGARIAQALLEIVINEISSHRKETYHYTAEQVIAKLQSDPSSAAIIGHVLNKISRAEMERLLIDLLPKAYFEAGRAEPRDEGIRQRAEHCFRMAMEMAPLELKRAAARRFLFILENESEYVVQGYESGLFRGSDLRYLEEEERAVVKAHFFASLAKKATPALVNAAAGIGEFLTSEEDLRSFYVPVTLSLLEDNGEEAHAAAVRRICDELARSTPAGRRAVAGWIGRLRWSLEQGGRAEAAARIAHLESLIAAMPA